MKKSILAVSILLLLGAALVFLQDKIFSGGSPFIKLDDVSKDLLRFTDTYGNAEPSIAYLRCSRLNHCDEGVKALS